MQRRPSGQIRQGERLGSVIEEQLHDGGRQPVRSAMQRGFAVVVNCIDVAAQFEHHPHAFVRFILRAPVLTRGCDADSRGHHQQRRVLGGGDRRIGPQLKQLAYQRRISYLGGHEERRGADPAVALAKPGIRILGYASVYVRSARDHLPGKRHGVDVAAGDRTRRIVAVRRLPHPRDRVQSRVADFRVVRYALVRIEPLVDEKQRELVVRIRRRQDHGTGSVRQLVSNVGTALEQGLDGLDMAGPHAEQKRRESADRRTSKPPRHLGLRAGCNVRTSLDQRPDGGVLTVGRRPHECCLAPLQCGVDVRAVVQQQPDGVSAPGARRGHQRRLTLADLRIRVGTGRQQDFEHRRTGIRGSQADRRDAERVGGIHIRTGAQQLLRRIGVVKVGRPMERRHPVGLRGVDIDLRLSQERDHGIEIGIPDGIHQRRRLPGHAGTGQRQEHQEEHPGPPRTRVADYHRGLHIHTLLNYSSEELIMTYTEEIAAASHSG